jgi:hypothetical protein
MWSALREETDRVGIRTLDLGAGSQGIVHVTGPEQGIVLPGLTVICGDSHTCTNGALGAIAFGVGNSQSTQALASQVLLQQRPRQMRITVDGALGPGVTAKDLALAIIGELGASAGAGYAVEYAGSGPGHPSSETAAAHDRADARSGTHRAARGLGSRLTIDDIPVPVRERAKHLILDGLGCALVGAQLPWSRTAVEAVLTFEGEGDCALIGWGRTTSAPAAALLNGTFIQGFELDDFHPFVRPALISSARPWLASR